MLVTVNSAVGSLMDSSSNPVVIIRYDWKGWL